VWWRQCGASSAFGTCPSAEGPNAIVMFPPYIAPASIVVKAVSFAMVVACCLLFLAAAFASVFPAVAVSVLGMQQGWALFYGGTSLLILVGVAIDTMQQVNSYLLNRHYDGLMKSGKNRKAVA